MRSFHERFEQARPDRRFVFGWFRAAQIILVLGLIFSIFAQATRFSISSRPPFAPSTWASLALGLAAILYLLASIVVNIVWGGFYFMFYYTSLNKPVLFNLLGVLMDLCFAGAFAVVLYAQTSVDEGLAGLWSLRNVGFDCLGFANFLLAILSTEPDEVEHDRSLYVSRCQALIATFAFVVINCFSFTLSAVVRLWYKPPTPHEDIEPAPRVYMPRSRTSGP